MHLLENDTEIAISETGSWVMLAGDKSFPLEDVGDFYRAWLLFEQPFQLAKAELEETARNAGFQGLAFPYVKLVWSALLSRTKRMVDHGMDWVPYLSEPDLALIAPILAETRSGTWASQRARQQANKFYKRSISAKQT